MSASKSRARGTRRRTLFSREDVITTVTYRRVRGVLRQVYNIRLAPLETPRFRWGLPLGKTLSKERAKRYRPGCRVRRRVAGVSTLSRKQRFLEDGIDGGIGKDKRCRQPWQWGGS